MVCGNAIAEIEGEKNMWQWHCRNRMKKKNLLQLVCGNDIAEIEERYKKKVRIFLSFQYFFFIETFWFAMFFYGKSTLRNRQGYFKYIDSYSKVHSVN